MADKIDRPAREYLRGILAAGARPFRYRSRTRALLGLPEVSGVRVHFAPVILGRRFPYLDHGQGSERRGGAPGGYLEERLDDFLPGAPSARAGFTADFPRSAPETERRPGPGPSAPRPAAGQAEPPESKLGPAVDRAEKAAPPAGPSTIPQPRPVTSLRIPGPALSASVVKAGGGSGAAAVEPARKPAGERPAPNAHLRAAEQPAVPAAAAAVLPEELPPAHRLAAESRGPLAQAASPVQSPPPGAGFPQKTPPPQPVPQGQLAELTTPGTALPAEYAAPPAPARGLVISPMPRRAAPSAPSAAGRKTPGRPVEKLSAAPRAGEAPEAPPLAAPLPAPLPSPQKVVVSRPGLRTVRVRRAFWERRHIRRAQIRILR